MSPLRAAVKNAAQRPAATAVVHGAAAVATRAMTFARPDAEVVPALVNGGAGVVVFAGGKCISVMSFTVTGGLIVEVASLADPGRLAHLDLSSLGV
jgi:RNA polymerase sigma-70 factor (ECF subfamily)